jgi:hypothetical protein
VYAKDNIKMDLRKVGCEVFSFFTAAGAQTVFLCVVTPSVTSMKRQH